MSENGCKNNIDADGTLTDEELDVVKDTWALVWKDKKQNSINLFLKLFKEYPEAQEKFKDFRGLSLEEVKGHKKLRAHALSVIYALKSFIDNLDDTETLEQLIKKNASNHVERKVTEQQIQWLVPAFMELLKDLMGEDLKDIHNSAWVKLFCVIRTLWKQEQDDVAAEQTT